MRRHHFESLRPICPRCYAHENVIAPLVIKEISEENLDFIQEGLLGCTNSQCMNEYPIIDGIPIIVPNIREFLKTHFSQITKRNNFSTLIESVLTDASGPGSEHNNTKHHISSYGWDHYGDLAPEGEFKDENPSAIPGSVMACLNASLTLLESSLHISKAPILDIGCALGRTSFELANKYDGLTLGIDINFSKLQSAQHVLQKSSVSFPLKQLGIAYHQHQYAINFPKKHHVDFWLCNALSLPFRQNTFQLASLLNVLDVVPAPKTLIVSTSNVLCAGGHAIISTPFDWSPPINMDSWIGGKQVHHSDKGDSGEILKSLFFSDKGFSEFNKLKLVAEIEHQPWTVRVHKRRFVSYDAHVFICEKL